MGQSHETATGIRVPGATIVIFGASGDLTARKLMPALFMLSRDGYLPDEVRIVGVARREKDDESFRREMHEAVMRHTRLDGIPEGDWEGFARRLHYCQYDFASGEQPRTLCAALEAIEQSQGRSMNRVVYLATAPELFLPAVESLSAEGLIPDHGADHWLRVVVEKPFGHDLGSARKLSDQLNHYLAEHQIYRIDHYLGKETVQNILLFRFGNSVFEPLLNRSHVEQVQITVAESQGVESGRGAYYDRSGALRDVLQNHLLQLLCLVAMEPPSLFRAREIRDEKIKVLQALAPGGAEILDWVVAGQYGAGAVNGAAVKAYRDEERIAADSSRETYIGMKVFVDNWRWAGVPFYLRTGKRMASRVTEIAIQFQLPPLHLFSTVECEGDICDLVEQRPNMLIIRIQPEESISMVCSVKRPGMNYHVQPTTMDFNYDNVYERRLPEAYERLLLDVLRGDTTLFTRNDELEAAWSFVTPVLNTIEADGFQPVMYDPGSWGPTAADALLRRDGHFWRVPTIQ